MSGRLVFHEVNPDLIYSGEMWVLNSTKVWQKKICRFDGRRLVWVRPTKFFEMFSHSRKGSKNAAEIDVDAVDNVQMSVTVSDRYQVKDHVIVPSLDCPMLSTPRDPFKLLTGKPGEYIDAKKRFPNYEILDLMNVKHVCVVTRSKKQKTNDKAMLEKIFVLQRNDGGNVFCRFKIDQDFKAWLFSIVNSLRFLKPAVVVSDLTTDDQGEIEDVNDSFSAMRNDSSTLEDLEAVQEALNEIANEEEEEEKEEKEEVELEENEDTRKEITKPLKGEEITMKEDHESKEPIWPGDAQPLNTMDYVSSYRKLSFDGVTPIESAGQIQTFSIDDEDIDKENESFTNVQRKKRNSEVNFKKLLSLRPRSSSLSDARTISKAAANDLPPLPEEPTETLRLVKGNKNAEHTAKVIRVNSRLYRQLSKHGIVGKSSTPSAGDNGFEMIVDPEMASLYRHLMTKLDDFHHTL